MDGLAATVVPRVVPQEKRIGLREPGVERVVESGEAETGLHLSHLGILHACTPSRFVVSCHRTGEDSTALLDSGH
ncbi:hypothetical protein Nans01_07150 [Nocardiopsis ansamitocini]|uniref:Uncharacterized protein n=1 Tax=Nocardiopsis ansamitocini TaxID=1670832 RepID=A0A9W6P326_9ACTN|nr:hypothetical protein Nans01_07150 [Nocardiopsis ansamitocini]